MPKYENVCPKNFELDLYTGCSFGCLYCIAAHRHAPQSAPVDPIELPLNNALDKQFPWYLSPWTDAYQPREAKTGLTRQVIQTLATQRASYFVITKGTLVIRDMDLFADRKNTFIAISLNTLDSRITKRIEPQAPPADERAHAIEKLLASRRIRTVVKIDPILPGITDGRRLDELLAWLCAVKPTAVTVETARLNRTIAARLRPALRPSEWAGLIRHYPPLTQKPRHPHTAYRLGLFHSLARRLAENNIRASFCKATLPCPITNHDCRGGF